MRHEAAKAVRFLARLAEHNVRYSQKKTMCPHNAAPMKRTQKPTTMESVNMALLALQTLSTRKKVTTAQVQAHLKARGYERGLRSIQRLMKALVDNDELGVESDGASANTGYTWGTHKTPLLFRDLSLQESLLLRLAEEHLKNLLAPETAKAMQAFFDQARSNMQERDNSHQAKAWMAKVRVVSETQPLLPPKINKDVLPTVAEALYTDHWLDVNYTNQKDVNKTHRVMPLGLVQQGPRMYLVCRFEGYDNERILALHRIKKATNTTLPFHRPNFDLSAYEDEGHLAVGNGERIQLRFDIDKAAGLHLLETPLSKDQTATPIDGGYSITATVQQTLMLDRWLRGFGGQVWNIEKKFKISTQSINL